jgi:hypothetical protein
MQRIDLLAALLLALFAHALGKIFASMAAHAWARRSAVQTRWSGVPAGACSSTRSKWRAVFERKYQSVSARG